MGLSVPSGVLLDHTQDKIILVDRDGRITYANQATEAILGWAPAAVVGENAFEYIHPDDVEKARSLFEETIASPTFAEASCELRYRTTDGEWKWLESRMSNVTDEQLDGYVVSSRDVSDRIQAQREREAVSARLAELSATTGEVLWMFSGDWSELLFVNPAFEDVYGVSETRLDADPVAFLEAVHPDDRPVVEDAMATLTAGDAIDLEYRVNPQGDYDTWVWVKAQPIVQDGDVVRITGFSRDVTDRHRRERQLSVMDTLLRHNIRNDLGIILGHAEQIAAEAPSVADHATVIRRTGADLLRSAEKERDIIEVLSSNDTLERVDVVPAVTEAIATVSERFPDAVFETSLPETAPVCCLSEIRLAIEELLENAVSHAQAATPRVTVSVVRRGDDVLVRVRDSGPDIPEMDAKVLTGQHETTDTYHSSGLGLWLVYWVVDLSNGGLAVEDTAEGGNEVEVRLPAADR